MPSPRPSPIPVASPIRASPAPTCTYCTEFCVDNNGGAGSPPMPTVGTCNALAAVMQSKDASTLYSCSAVNATCAKACGTGQPGVDGICRAAQLPASNLVGHLGVITPLGH